MKKFVVSIVLVVTCLMLSMFCLTACGGGAGTGDGVTSGIGAGSRIEGNYVGISIKMGDAPSVSVEDWSLEVKGNGQLSFSGDTEETGSWEKTGDNEYSVVFNNTPGTATVNDGILTMTVPMDEQGNQVIKFQKIVVGANKIVFGEYKFSLYRKMFSGQQDRNVTVNVGDQIPNTDETATVDFLNVIIKSYGEVIFTTNSQNAIYKAGTGSWRPLEYPRETSSQSAIMIYINGKQITVDYMQDGNKLYLMEPAGMEYTEHVLNKILVVE